MDPVGSWAAVILLGILCFGFAYGVATRDKGVYYVVTDKERNGQMSFTTIASKNNEVTVHENWSNGLDAAIFINQLINTADVDRISVERDGNTVQEYEAQQVRDGESVETRWFVRGGTVTDWTLVSVVG